MSKNYVENMTQSPASGRVLTFAGVMYSDERVYEAARATLEEKIGRLWRESPVFPFDFTRYYEREMGPGLLKRFISFAGIPDRGRLAELKILTNQIEGDFVQDGRRRVNIDPGYVTPHNVVLATTKEFPHRVYIGRGIFAEVTMTFRRSEPRFFPWTYPDYRTDTARAFFMTLRRDVLTR